MPHTSPTRPAEIMVVDDDQDVREAVGEFLLQAGYAATSAKDGAEALARLLLGDCDPSLTILDLDMPIMDGREFLDRLAADERLNRVPVIVLSATATSGTLRDKVRVISKPVEGERLLAEIHASLTTSSPRRASHPRDIVVKMPMQAPAAGRRIQG